LCSRDRPVFGLERKGRRRALWLAWTVGGQLVDGNQRIVPCIRQQRCRSLCRDDVFVIDHVSIGGSAAISYGLYRGIDPTSNAPVTSESIGVGIGPRVGFDAPITDHLSWFPRAGLDLGWSSYDEQSASRQNKFTLLRATVSVFAPLLVHPATHFFVGLGPYFSHDLTGTVDGDTNSQLRATTISLSSVIGGWR
jgi:hypothetical protein